MLFQSWLFVLFFAIFYAVYLAVKRTRIRNLWILIASYFFYGWFEPWFLILLAYSTVIDYFCLARMEKARRRKGWLFLSIINSLLLLGFFKYSSFAVENINYILSLLGSEIAVVQPSIMLPVGLSFYIFKSIGYVVDCYRGQVEREKNIINHAVFVSFFPLLLAGPIERASNLLSQIKKTPRISMSDFTDGLSLFVTGLFKKIALADQLAVFVGKVYESPSEYNSAALILATFAFGWQLYFDFSGYSDMARGISRMMGFRIMLNFNNPYLASSLRDFWRRWHISLSSWFRDYVYIPLGGNRKGKLKTYRNIMLTMVTMGLWHGAAWTFVLWGAVHGLFRCLTGDFEKNHFFNQKVPLFIKQIFIFVFVTLAWVLFRAASLTDAGIIYGRIFSTLLSDPGFPLVFLALIFLIWIYQLIYESKIRWILQNAIVKTGCVVFMIMYLLIFVTPAGRPFIYFQF